MRAVVVAAMVAAVMAIASGLGSAHAADCAAAGDPCRRQELVAAEADLGLRVKAAMSAIDAWDGNLDDADRVEWKDRLTTELRLWTDFAVKRCAGERGGEPAVVACRLHLTAVMADDITARFSLADAEPALGPGRYRRSVEAPAPPPEPMRDVDSELGPCADAPPGDCDYCGFNACFDRLIGKAQKTMDKAFKAALKSAGGRRAGIEAEQAAFAAWAAAACEDAAFETPNRWANSIYSEIVAPCTLAETQARVTRLKAVAKGG